VGPRNKNARIFPNDPDPASRKSRGNLAKGERQSSGAVALTRLNAAERVSARRSKALGPSCTNIPHERYFFYETKSGALHFHVEASSTGQFPVEEAAGMLAIQCLVRGRCPTDYLVMVEAANRSLSALNKKTEELLKAAYCPSNRIPLTRREEQVLCGVMRNLTNKEIAVALNLSERTVKFHVSSLFTKFGTRGRMELIRQVSSHSAVPPIQVES
jgi:DNA-binding CsgD family transcriptional regulator